MRKLSSLLIALTIVLTSLTPVYANNCTGQALRINSLTSIHDVKATTDTSTVSPSSYGIAPYYYNGSSTGLPQNNMGSSSTWSGIINGISYSIAYSMRSLGSVVNTSANNINTTLGQIYSRLATTNTYIDNVHDAISGLNSNVISIYSLLGDINSSNTNIDSKLTTIGTTVSDILSAILNLSFTVPQELIDDVDSIENKVPSQDYYWKKYLTNSSGQIPTISQGGVYRPQSFDFNSNSLLGGIEALLYYGLTGTTNGVSLLVRDVRDNNAALDDYLYDASLNPTLIPRTTVWQNMRDFWTNTSFYLSRLAYVLANDTDIQARQDAQNQTQATMNDFIKPTGKSSVSTSNLGDLANMSDNLQDAMNTNVSANSTMSIFSDNENWSWFTQDTANAFDTVNNTTNNRLRSKSNSTPYLDSYYEEVNNAIGH